MDGHQSSQSLLITLLQLVDRQAKAFQLIDERVALLETLFTKFVQTARKNDDKALDILLTSAEKLSKVEEKSDRNEDKCAKLFVEEKDLEEQVTGLKEKYGDMKLSLESLSGKVNAHEEKEENLGERIKAVDGRVDYLRSQLNSKFNHAWQNLKMVYEEVSVLKGKNKIVEELLTKLETKVDQEKERMDNELCYVTDKLETIEEKSEQNEWKCERLDTLNEVFEDGIATFKQDLAKEKIRVNNSLSSISMELATVGERSEMNEEKCGWLTKENEAFKVRVAELETRSLNEVGTNKVAEIGEAVRAEVEKVAAGFFSVEVGRSNAIASGNRPKSVTQDLHEGLEVCKAIVDKVGASQNAATNQPVIGCESPLKLKPAVETKLVSKFKAGPSIYIERWRKHFAKINLKKPKIFDKILPSKTVGWGDIGAKLPQDVLDSFVRSHVLATQLSLNEKRQKAIIRNFNSVSLLSDMTFKHQSVNEIWFELIAFLQRKETFFQDADKSVIAIFLVRALRDGPVFGPCMLDTLGYLAESEYYNMHWFLLIRRSFRQTLLSLIPSVLCIYIRAACTNIRGHHATLQNYQDHIPLLREIHKNRYFIIQWFLYVLYEKNLIYPVNLIQLRLLLLSTTIETRKPVFEFSTILRTLDKIEKDMKLRQMEFIVPPIDLNAMSRKIKELMQNAP